MYIDFENLLHESWCLGNISELNCRIWKIMKTCRWKANIYILLLHYDLVHVCFDYTHGYFFNSIFKTCVDIIIFLNLDKHLFVAKNLKARQKIDRFWQCKTQPWCFGKCKEKRWGKNQEGKNVLWCSKITFTREMILIRLYKNYNDDHICTVPEMLYFSHESRVKAEQKKVSKRVERWAVRVWKLNRTQWVGFVRWTQT